MIRTDGHFEFYKIQHRMNGRWHFSDFDYFGCPKGFNANGECWQETGENATFDHYEASNGLKWISLKNPSTKFRLVTVIIDQSTFPISIPTKPAKVRKGRR